LFVLCEEPLGFRVQRSAMGGEINAAEQRNEFACGMEIASAQRHASLVMPHEMAGRGSDAGQPIRKVFRVPN
jgi:hypothetical protein